MVMRSSERCVELLTEVPLHLEAGDSLSVDSPDLHWFGFELAVRVLPLCVYIVLMPHAISIHSIERAYRL